MENRLGQNGVKKRSQNACQRCRRHKIKCSGSAPCSNCSKRQKTCIFDNIEPSVSVSKRYLSNLEKRLLALEKVTDEPIPGNRSTGSSPGVISDGDQDQTHLMGIPPSRPNRVFEDSPRLDPPHTILTSPAPGPENQETVPSWTRFSSADIVMTNPLSAVYLGTSSNWSFSRRILDCTHRVRYGSPLSPNNFALDGEVYNLGWDGSRVLHTRNSIALPPRNEAIYLLRSVQFYIGEQYHLFDEDTMMQGMNLFYTGQLDLLQPDNLQYVHFLLVMAIGKALVFRSVHKDRPAGVDIFVYAMKVLPDVTQLWHDPFMAAEVYCCIALYLQCADWRFGAYLTIGHAIRTALFQGMHTDMPDQTFGTDQIERARRIWWTVYILDRELSCLMGLPIQIADEYISARFPTRQSREQALALDLHIKICRIVSQVVSTVYGSDGSLDRRFLISTQSALTRIADVAKELKSSFPLQLEDSSQSISRLVATLHLHHHYCIVLTTRPLMFSLFKMRLDLSTKPSKLTPAIQRLRVLLEMCTDSSEHSLSILSALQKQGLLSTFLPFDMESTFCSAIIMLIAAFIEPVLIDDLPSLLLTVHQILDDLIIKGNLIACHRKAEIEQLNEMLDTIKSRNNARAASPIPHSTISRTNPEQADPEQETSDVLPLNAIGGQEEFSEVQMQSMFDQPFSEWNWQDALSSEQLMNVVSLLEGDQLIDFNLPLETEA